MAKTVDTETAQKNVTRDRGIRNRVFGLERPSCASGGGTGSDLLAQTEKKPGFLWFLYRR